MRFGLGILVAFIVLGYAPIASAETISVSQKIYIHAVVAPTRTIVVNDQGQIMEIDSNTSQAVLPTVFLGSAASGSQQPLTSQIYDQYQRLLPQNAGAGALYKAKMNQAATGPKLVLTTDLI